MGKAVRWLGYGLGGVLVLALVAAIAIYALSQRALADPGDAPALALAQPTGAQLADAPRQLRVMGCISCHGEGLRGRKFFAEDNVATIYAPNLALLASKVDDATLDRAIRGGIGHDGRPLLAMPSEHYQFLTDAEAAALIAAIRALPPGGTATPAVEVGPLARLGLASGGFKPAPALAAEYAANPLPRLGDTEAGRHLAALYCAGCHGPDLAGKEVEPGVVSADLATAAGYDAAQFRALLRQGVAPSGKDLGLMAQVSKDDFSHLTDAEIDAIHAYLDAHAKRPR